jgi:WD40 repeat protein/uncharacterized caspase-like protein
MVSERLNNIGHCVREQGGSAVTKLITGFLINLTICLLAMLSSAMAANSASSTPIPPNSNASLSPTGFAPIETIPNLPQSASSLVLSTDGRMLLAGGTDGVRLWDVHSGRLIRVFTGHASTVTSVVFTADGTQFLSASKDRTVKLWEVATGKLLRTTKLQTSATDLWDSKLAPDGNSVLVAPINSSPIDKTVKLFDVLSGRLIRTFPAEAWIGAICVAFSADGKRALSGGSGALGGGGKVKLWDVASGRLLKSFEGGHGQFEAVYLVAISPDGKRIVSGDANRTVIVWETDSGRMLQKLTLGPKAGWSRAASFSSDGTKLVTGANNDKAARVWDLQSGRLLQTIDFAYSGVGAALFLPNSSDAILSDDASALKLFDVRDGAERKSFGRRQKSFGHADFTADGSKIVSAVKSVTIWDAGTGQLDNVANHDGDWAAAVGLNGTRAVFKAPDNTLEFWDIAQQRTISIMRGHAKTVERVTLSPDGATVLSGSSDKTARIWDGATGKQLRSFTLTDQVIALDYSPDGKSVVAGDESGVLRRYDIASGKQLWNVKVSSLIVWSARFSPDGKFLIVGAIENAPLLLDASDGRVLRKYEGHTDSIFTGPVFSPDGKTFLSGSYDKTVRLWDTASGNVIFSKPVNSYLMKFSPDGRRILLNNEIIDAHTGESLVRLIISDGDQPEWVAVTPEGFFNASPHGADMLSVVHGIEVYAIDQFYQSLYRPDLIRDKLAGDPRGSVRAAAADLDLNKVIASGSAPDVGLTLLNRTPGQDPNDGTTVSAQAEIADHGGGVGRVEWRVNGVTAGVDAPAPGSVQPVQLTRSFSLDAGDNTIEVVAYNGANLIASIPTRLNVASQISAPSIVPPPSPAQSSPPAPVAVAKPRLLVLVAGVNEYADKRIKLSYAVSDAKSVAQGFQEAGQDLYQSVEIKLMIDAEVTRDKLGSAFEEMTSKAQSSDVFVLYLAGHGKTVDGRYYFVPQDFTVDGELTDKAVNASVKSKAIAQDQWQRWFASIPARKSLILFDTCDSGTLTGDAAETQQLEKGAANDRLAQATGRSIITASAGNEEALEGYRGHGLFTYELLDAINKADGDKSGTVEVNELAAYAYAQVSEISQKLFKQRQVPQMKITANYALAKQTRILQDEAIPVAEIKPDFQLAQTAQLQIQPSTGATVVRSLSAKTRVTVIESRSGWSLIASEGTPLGYIATHDLVPVQ